MRYTRTGFASYAIASVLLTVVVGVAWSRSRPMDAPMSASTVEPATDSQPVSQESGEAAWQAECAGCHGAGEARGRSVPSLRRHAVELFISEGGRAYLIDLMLTGGVRFMQQGRVVYDKAHPGCAGLSDQQVADILNYMLTSWGNGGLLPESARLYTAAEVATRR